METNLHFVANFIHNPWMESQGNYYGLFTNEGTDFKNSGFVNLTIGTNRMFSGRLLMDGDSLALSGNMNVDGTRNLVVLRKTTGKPPVTVSLQTLFADQGANGTNQIVGTVSDAFGT